MQIKRKFTKAGENPYHSVKYEWRTSTIRNEDGSSASRSVSVESPVGWSQVATDILAQKYLRRSDVPQLNDKGEPLLDENGKQVTGGENSVRQVVDRLVGCWQHWGDEHNYFNSPEDSQAFYDEVVHMMLKQMAAPNSPQWFNTGLALKYGIKGTYQGHWYVDPKTHKMTKSEDAFTHPQPHACFIQSVDDDLLGDNGIYSLLTREGRIFKFGSGTGTNFSNIRGVGEALGSGGFSSGLMSFLRIYDRAAGSIKSGGTTRRAAKMVCLDIDHPEVEEFIKWKSNEERKVGALVTGVRSVNQAFEKILKEAASVKDASEEAEPLVKAVRDALDMGLPEGMIKRALQLGSQGITEFKMDEMSTDYEGDAYATVSGQNSNNSVRIPHKFMSLVQKNGDWDLTGRVDGKAVKTIKASKLWEDIAIAAWECADPGLQFDDTINDWHTCPSDGRIRSSNPCSEYMFLDDTACNLASINLVHFIDSKGHFDVDSFNHAVRLWTTVLEISVTMAQFPSLEIAQRSFDYRTLGLGYANLGSILMRMGIAYDSKEAAALTGAITAVMCGTSYATSAELAGDHGAFARYEANKKDMLRVIRNHRRAAYNTPVGEYEQLGITPIGLNKDNCPSYLAVAAREAWDKALELGEKHGYRNAQVTVIAPTGTIGLVMDCDTTGIEPDFALVKFKKLSGGGYFKIVNQSVAPALRTLGYNQDQIKAIELYCKGHASLKDSPHINEASLKAKGFTQEVIDLINGALPGAFEIHHAINSYVIGQDFLAKKLNVPSEQLNHPNFNILSFLGFTQSQIEEANLYICGRQTIEGAPYLAKEHYPVFDCANTCGPHGTRSIAPKGHLRIMAAAQSFISGAISKTFNLPGDASVADVKDIYRTAWEMGLKAVSIYRDSSKLSQPLSSSGALPKVMRLAKQRPAEPEKPVVFENVQKKKQPEPLSWPQSKRRQLPTRRDGFVQEAEVGGHKIFLRTGEYPDGTLGEIFIDMYKEGASYRGLLNCFAVLTSKALQYGVPLEKLVDSFTFTRFEPSGIVSGHEQIKSATSILDFIFRTLGHHYLGLNHLTHVKSIEDVPENTKQKKESKSNEKEELVLQVVDEGATARLESRRAGYTGDTCGSCGSLRVRRNGTCTLCDDCGSTSGCS